MKIKKRKNSIETKLVMCEKLILKCSKICLNCGEKTLDIDLKDNKYDFESIYINGVEYTR